MKKFASRGQGSSRSVTTTHWLVVCMFAALVAISMSATSATAQTLPADACIAKCKASMAASIGSDEAAVKAADEECAKSCAGGVATTTPAPAPVEEFDVASCPTPKKGKSIDVDASEEKGKCLLKDFETSDCTPKKGKSVDLETSEEKQKCAFKDFETSDCKPKKGKQLDEEKSETRGRCIYAVAPPAEDKPVEKAESQGTMPWWIWLVIVLLVLAFVGMTASRQREAKCANQYRLSEEEGRVEAQRRRDAEARRQSEDDDARRRQEAVEELARRREAMDAQWRERERQRERDEVERRRTAGRRPADPPGEAPARVVSDDDLPL